MILKCDDSYIPQVVEYIGEDKWQCLYLYADMLEYRTEGNQFNLWIFKNEDEIDSVAYRYYDTIHFYSRNQTVNDEMISLINELQPKCITGSQDMMDQIKNRLTTAYTEELSYVFTIDHLIEEKRKLPVVEATEADVPEIAEIMMEEEVYSHVYSYDDICRQMTDRIRIGKGRVFILRDKSGHILASSGTYVETLDIVLTGGLIVSKKVKGFGFGPAMATYVWNLIFREGKQAIGLESLDNEDSKVMNQKLGYTIIGVVARLLRNK